MDASSVGIMVFYNGNWVTKRKFLSYEGGQAKGILVSSNITFNELVERVCEIGSVDRNRFRVQLKYSITVSGTMCKHINIEDDDDVKYFLNYSSQVITSNVVPVLATFDPVELSDKVVSNGNFTTQAEPSQNNETANNVVDESIGTYMNGTDAEDEVNGTYAPNLTMNCEGVSEPDSVPTFEVNSEPAAPSNRKRKLQVCDHAVADSSSRWQDAANYERGLSCINWKPELREGQVYANKDVLQRTLCLAAVRGNFQYKTSESSKSRLVVRCLQSDCPWRLRGRRVGAQSFLVVKYHPTHECDSRSINNPHPKVVKGMVSDAIKRKLKDAQTILTPADVMSDVQQRFGIKISYSTAWRSKELALEAIRGSAPGAVELCTTVLPAENLSNGLPA